MTKIFYDGLIYAAYPKQPGGISRYFDNLISRLPEDFYPGLTTGRERGGSHPTHPNLQLYRFDLKFRPGRICNWLKKEYFQYIFERYKPQLVHPTYYSLLTERKIKDYQCPVALTVYDMIHEKFADLIDAKGETKAIKKEALFSADSIMCISESTKRDLLELYPSLEDKTTVIYLATEMNESYIRSSDLVPKSPYYLYIGGRETYKNFNQLLLALSKIINKFPELLLVVVGSPFNDDETKQISDLKLAQNVEYWGRADDYQLAKLYKHSLALVYPSLYEGFGIPPLEATSCGTTVIASNISSIPEVVGDAGLLFDPTSVDELIDRLSFLIDNPIQRNNLIKKGKQQVQKFSWEKTAMETVNVYKSML